jgi:hypothetical protein
VARETVKRLDVTIGTDVMVHRLLASYHSAVEVVDRSGKPGVGVTNLKRMFGHPAELRALVAALGASLPDADALAAADSESGR